MSSPHLKEKKKKNPFQEGKTTQLVSNHNFNDFIIHQSIETATMMYHFPHQIRNNKINVDKDVVKPVFMFNAGGLVYCYKLLEAIWPHASRAMNCSYSLKQ